MHVPRRPAGQLAARYATIASDILATERTPLADASVGLVATFVAGAINAGGLLAVGQYTSHMSGVVSAMADNLILGSTGLILGGFAALLAFVAGAAVSAILVNWARLHRRGSEYALPLALEAVLLLGFGTVGDYASQATPVLLAAVGLLCFIMGLQNATVTKLSGARIRTTHVTGIVTDVGIELGKLLYSNRRRHAANAPLVLADRQKLRILGLFLLAFFLGGVTGAFGFSYFGFVFAVPLAVVLLVLAAPALRSRMARI